MEWRKSYLDMILVPLGLLISILYHAWLWRKIRSQPHQTVIGVNSTGRQLWVLAMMKDKERSSVLAVQTIRNSIMGSTLMATTSILLSSGLAAMLSSTYTIKKPLDDTLYGARGELAMAVKYAALLLLFLLAFLSYSFSISLMSQVGFLLNVQQQCNSCNSSTGSVITCEYVCGLMEKGFGLSTVGNRVFYAALPLLLWVFGPVLVFFCYVLIALLLYCMDSNSSVACGDGKVGDKGGVVMDDNNSLEA